MTSRRIRAPFKHKCKSFSSIPHPTLPPPPFLFFFDYIWCTKPPYSMSNLIKLRFLFNLQPSLFLHPWPHLHMLKVLHSIPTSINNAIGSFPSFKIVLLPCLLKSERNISYHAISPHVFSATQRSQVSVLFLLKLYRSTNLEPRKSIWLPADNSKISLV